MKVLKYILITLVVIIAVPLIVALFVKSDYKVEREIVINKPRADVFNYIKYIKNQDNYSTWNRRDPSMEKKYSGTDGTVGFIAGWNSIDKEVGEGEQEIKAITEGERIQTELRFKRPFEGTDTAYFVTTDASATSTKVVWGFDGSMPYPMNLMCLFMDMDKMLGAELEKGLVDLKGILEKQETPEAALMDSTKTTTM